MNSFQRARAQENFLSDPMIAEGCLISLSSSSQTREMQVIEDELFLSIHGYVRYLFDFLLFPLQEIVLLVWKPESVSEFRSECWTWKEFEYYMHSWYNCTMRQIFIWNMKAVLNFEKLISIDRSRHKQFNAMPAIETGGFLHGDTFHYVLPIKNLQINGKWVEWKSRRWRFWI